MRRARALAIAAVTASAALALAAGTGEIAATEPVAVVTITSPTGSGSATATLENTTTNTTFNVLVAADATCDPDVTFSVPGGNPLTSFAPGTSRSVTIQCPPRDDEAMRRCLLHATNTANGELLGDVVGLCLYGASPPSLTPVQAALDFGTVTVGEFAEQTLTIRNDATTGSIRRVYLTTSDIDGNFELTTPCNPDGAYCDVDLTSSVGAGATFAVGVKCRPQAAGTHTAQLYVGTDTFQLLSLGVTLTCEGAPATGPALAIHPTTIELPAPLDVAGATASVDIELANAGSGTLLVKDVRVVDVDTGAAEDWTYDASGRCSGQITSACMLGPGDRVALAVTFDPSAIGSRRATLLVAYQDSLDRTLEIPLDGAGLGATLRRPGAQTALTFGSVPVGRSSELSITLVNDGNRDTTAAIALTPMTTPPFSTTPASAITVSPGMPRQVTLACEPQTSGTFTTTLTLTSPDAPMPLTVSATCEGTTDDLYASPTALLVGEIPASGTSTYTVQLEAASGGPIDLAGTPTLEVATSAISISPLSTQTTPASFDVTITPQAPGPINATILVETEGGDTLRIPLVASAVTTTYITADTLDLGTFCVDQPTASSNLTLLSTGTGTIEVSAPSLAKSPSPFDLRLASPAVYPHLLPAGKGAVVAVTPHRQRTAMTVEDTLTWQTNAPDAPTATTQLRARFVESGGAIAPTALNFGEATVHLYVANGQRVVIQNCNPTPLVLDPPLVRTPFSIDSPGFPTMLSPNESVAFSVGFHPTRVGTVMDTLRITSPQLPGAPLEVILVGTGSTGTSPPPDGGMEPGGDDDGGCGCRSTKQPLGVILVALVGFVVLSARRRSGLP